MQEIQQLYEFKLKEAQLLSKERDSLIQALQATMLTEIQPVLPSHGKQESDYTDIWNFAKQRAELVVLSHNINFMSAAITTKCESNRTQVNNATIRK